MAQKIIAKKGKILYCEELKRYATATTDIEHEWVEVDVEPKQSEEDNNE